MIFELLITYKITMETFPSKIVTEEETSIQIIRKESSER